MEKYLIVGLGNIGEEYKNTRHNIGFDILDSFAEKHNLTFKIERYAFYADYHFKGKKMILIKPTTYMNLSGNAVLYWKNKENIKLENIFILVDDIAISLLQIRIKSAGSHGGHNGLKSLEQNLNTTQYTRLRFGIGNDYNRGQQVDFVLGKWNKQEQNIIQEKIKISCNAIEKFPFIPLSLLMNEINAITFK